LLIGGEAKGGYLVGRQHDTRIHYQGAITARQGFVTSQSLL
jgi:hypothetical protein